jgi:hypothetical protein
MFLQGFALDKFDRYKPLRKLFATSDIASLWCPSQNFCREWTCYFLISISITRVKSGGWEWDPLVNEGIVEETTSSIFYMYCTIALEDFTKLMCYNCGCLFFWRRLQHGLISSYMWGRVKLWIYYRLWIRFKILAFKKLFSSTIFFSFSKMLLSFKMFSILYYLQCNKIIKLNWLINLSTWKNSSSIIK